MHVPLVDLKAQYHSIKPEIDQALSDIIESGLFIGGPAVDSFSEKFAAKCHTKYCVPCANGTDALEIALQSLGIGKGDEVIIPAFSFVATLEAVHNIGATPVLCDIDPDRYTLDVPKAISLVSERTKIFMPVHLYGQMTDMDPLMSFATDNNMFVIEDAAQAHGALYKNQNAGSIGEINSFSFYPGKNLGAYGDAGALTTDSEWLYTKAKKIANHGRIAKYDHDIMGRNSRLDAIQAAILEVKLRYLDAWIARRQEIAGLYHDQLMHIEQIKLPQFYPHSMSVFHLYVIRVPSADRDDFRYHLRSLGIETGVHYPVSLSRVKAVTDQLKIKASCPQAEKASGEVVSLPIYPEMMHSAVEYICHAIRQYFAKK
jgi:dTDP-4-amino-4,6-dideoxygalactose transaminase